MTIHYGNWIVDGILGVGEEISGGYVFPTTIGASAEVMVVTVDHLNNKSIEFKDLREAPYNFSTKDDLDTALSVAKDEIITELSASGSPQYLVDLLDVSGDFSNNKGKVLAVNSSETLASFVEPKSNFEDITKSSHGFSAGNVIYRSISGSYELAIADINNPEKAEVIGVVQESLNVNKFRLVYSGKIENLSGLVDGSVYFLSDTISGGLTTVRPTSLNSIIKPVLIATGSTSGVIINQGALSSNNVYVSQTTDITGNTTLNSSHHYIRANTNLNNITITLPSLSSNQKRIYKIKKINSNNRVVIQTTGGDLIDNQSSYNLDKLQSVEVIGGTTSWDVNYNEKNNFRLVTTNTTLLNSDCNVNISGSEVIIVPNASSVSNEYTLKNLGSTTVVICGVNLIEEESFQQLYSGETFTLYNDSNNWWVK